MSTVVKASTSGPYTATGQTTFPVTFQSRSSSEISVFVDETEVAPASYTFNRNDDGTGSVVISYPVTGSVFISSNPNFQELAQFSKYGAFYPDQLNPVFDGQARTSLHLLRILSRTPQVPMWETLDELPAKAQRASRYMLFDSEGNPTPGMTDAQAAGFLMPSSVNVGDSGYVRPDLYGAAGNGVTNDTTAMHSMTAVVNSAAGGGVDLLPKRTYIVGRQADSRGSPTNFDGVGTGPVYYNAEQILHFNDLDGFVFRGNGAQLKAASGLKHGAFNLDGSAKASTNGYTGDGAAQAYPIMVWLQRCKNFTIENLILNGNSDGLTKGGPWGDTGWQVGGTGLQLEDCSNYTVRRCTFFGHPSDGLQVAGACNALNCVPENGTFEDCILELNGRQGCSLIGGKGLTFRRCSFSFNGRNSRTDSTVKHPFLSAPASGVDVEAEGVREVHDITFEESVFLCNEGSGFLYAGGGASGIHFNDCVFVADVGYALYNAAVLSGARFTRCYVIGVSLWQGNGGTDPAIFDDVIFLDSADYSPTGVVNDTGPIVDFGGGNTGLLVKNCKMLLTADAVAPAATVGMTFRDFTLSQANPNLTGFGGGRLEGRTSISGNLDMGGDLHINSSSNGLFFDHLTINGNEISTSAELANFHGVRIRGYDGANQHSYRVGIWNNPVDWAGQVGGAAKGDIVISSLDADGGGALWQCKTAPGTTNMSQWRTLGIKGATKAATVGGLSPGDTPDVIGARVNDLINKMRVANLME